MWDGDESLATLDASIARGLAEADAARTKPAEEVFDRLETEVSKDAGEPELAPAFLTGKDEG